MLIYSLIFISGIIAGIFLYWLFDKKIQISVNIKHKFNVSSTRDNKKIVSKQNNINKTNKYYKATCLINEIQQNGKLPIHISPAVQYSLDIISKTSNWQSQIDDESLNNLNKIYDKWQRHLKANMAETVHAGEAVNMELNYWEGTEEEYEKALEDGLIDEHTKIKIIFDEKNYKGSWITHNVDGSVTEYMD